MECPYFVCYVIMHKYRSWYLCIFIFKILDFSVGIPLNEWYNTDS